MRSSQQSAMTAGTRHAAIQHHRRSFAAKAYLQVVANCLGQAAGQPINFVDVIAVDVLLQAEQASASSFTRHAATHDSSKSIQHQQHNGQFCVHQAAGCMMLWRFKSPKLRTRLMVNSPPGCRCSTAPAAGSDDTGCVCEVLIPLQPSRDCFRQVGTTITAEHQQTGAVACMMHGHASIEARTRGFWSTPPAWHVVDSMSSPQAISAKGPMTVDSIAVLGSSCLVNVRCAAAVHARAMQQASISAEYCAREFQHEGTLAILCLVPRSAHDDDHVQSACIR
jgi:hypothetical protein